MSKVCAEEIILPASSNYQNNIINGNNEENDQNSKENQLKTFNTVFPNMNINHLISPSSSFCYGMLTGYFYSI